MRKFNNYLFKDFYHVFPFFLKSRILKFKRPKWKRIQSRISYIKKQFLFIIKRNKRNLRKLKSFIALLVKSLNYLFSFKLLKRRKKTNQQIFFKKKFFNFLQFLKTSYFLKLYKNIYFQTFNTSRYLFKVRRFKEKNDTSFFSFYYFNFRILKKIKKFKLRRKFYFKNRLLMKYNILKYFYGSISIKFFKNYLFSFPQIKSHKALVSQLLVQPEYRIDILLWRLKFFKTPYLARYACNNNFIFLNNNFLNINNNFLFKKTLKKGDILFSAMPFSFKSNLKLYSKSIYLPSIFEIDYYSNLIICLNNFMNINYKDINTILKEPICAYKLKDYLLK